MTVATHPCRVSIVIKAFNEEANICAAIESSLRALAHVGGEVILADSCSTDATVARAGRYPIRIVQLAHTSDRSCGAGPQLGYQHSRGEYVYVLDGDMQILPGFLERALALMAQHPEVAGVAGRQIELNQESLEYRERSSRVEAHKAPGPVDRLDGGGLYRRRAIEEAGFLSDRNLHSYEEYDLASRLRALGWKLWRLPADATTHHGHDTPPYSLLLKRWHSRYACGMGELVRSAAGQPRMKLVLRDVRELRLYSAALLWWLVLLSAPFWPLDAGARMVCFMLLAAMPLVVMTWRKKSVLRAAYSVASWCVNAAGLVRGLVAPRQSPRAAIPSLVLKEPHAAARQGQEFCS